MDGDSRRESSRVIVKRSPRRMLWHHSTGRPRERVSRRIENAASPRGNSRVRRSSGDDGLDLLAARVDVDAALPQQLDVDACASEIGGEQVGSKSLGQPRPIQGQRFIVGEPESLDVHQASPGRQFEPPGDGWVDTAISRADDAALGGALRLDLLVQRLEAAADVPEVAHARPAAADAFEESLVAQPADGLAHRLTYFSE